MAKVDRKSVAELQSSMGSSFAQLAQFFIEDMQSYREQMIQAFDARRLEEARRIAHTVKSTSLLFGGTELSTQAREAEEAIASGDRAAAKLQALQAGIAEYLDDLKRVLPAESTGQV
jgi:HPt (histidine-containing phosphotransfer) domain-containing protein